MQTLLALGALAIAGLLAFSIQQAQMHTHSDMIRGEVEALALTAAEDQLDAALRLPFDANGEATLPAQLTPAGAFGTAAGTLAAAADLDDLHGATGTVSIATAEGTLALAVSAQVRYVVFVGGAYMASPVQTFVKELTVTVAGPQQARVTVSRLYPHRMGL